MKQVVQYNCKGYFICIYPNTQAAAKATGLKETSIRACTNGYLKSIKGYQFKHTRNIKFNIGNKQPKAVRGPVMQMDKYNNQLMIWPSQKAAADWLGVKASAISRCLHGHVYMSAGFKWRYCNESV